MFAYQRLKYVCLKRNSSSSLFFIIENENVWMIRYILFRKTNTRPYSFSSSTWISMYFKNIFWTNIMGRKCKLTRKKCSYIRETRENDHDLLFTFTILHYQSLALIMDWRQYAMTFWVNDLHFKTSLYFHVLDTGLTKKKTLCLSVTEMNFSFRTSCIIMLDISPHVHSWNSIESHFISNIGNKNIIVI